MRLFLLCTLCAAVAVTGCKKKKAPEPVAKQEEQPAAPPVDPRNTAHVAGAGALQNVRQAARRAVAHNDMAQLGVFILDLQLMNNKMPTVSEIRASLKAPDAGGILKQIDEGTIILTGTTDANGLWAYEVDADKAGGLVLTGPSANARRASAEDVKALLGK